MRTIRNINNQREERIINAVSHFMKHFGGSIQSNVEYAFEKAMGYDFNVFDEGSIEKIRQIDIDDIKAFKQIKTAIDQVDQRIYKSMSEFKDNSTRKFEFIKEVCKIIESSGASPVIHFVAFTYVEYSKTAMFEPIIESTGKNKHSVNVCNIFATSANIYKKPIGPQASKVIAEDSEIDKDMITSKFKI